MSMTRKVPIIVGLTAAHAVQRHASDAVDRARSVELPVPVDAAKHARRRARRAAQELEHRVDRASRRAAKRVRQESRRVARRAAPRRRGRRTVVVLLVVAGGAAVVAVLAKRMQQVKDAETIPDPFGTAVRAAEPEHLHDRSSVTTG
jgi:hypothetical protein